MNSAAARPGWAPLSSKSRTSSAGLASPDRMSQEVVASSSAFLDRLQRGQAAGRHDDDVGLLRLHVGSLGVGVESDIDLELFELGQAPVDDADDFAAALDLDGETDLTAGFACRLEQRYLVAALGADARRFETGRSGADDHHVALAPARRGDHVRHAGLAAGGRIVDAQGVVAFIDAVEAVGRAHAGPDVALPCRR